jgi:murein DD-endopeptidase MepM/ murein hydrolase activator NlpD
MLHSFSSPPAVKIRSRTIPKGRRKLNRLLSVLLAGSFLGGCYVSLYPHEEIEAIIAQAETVTIEQPIDVAIEAPIETPPEPSTEIPAPELALAEPVTLAAPPAPIKTYPYTKELTVANGDNFVSLLGKAGIGNSEAHELLEAMGKKFNPRSLKIGNKVMVTVDKNIATDETYAAKLSLEVSPLSTLTISANNGGNYKVEQKDKPISKQLARAGGKITSSLYETIVSGGMPSNMVGEIIKAYSYDIDFQRDIQAGDSIDIVFERMATEDGKTVGYGNILYASLSTGKRDLRIYRYKDKDGFGDYYNAKGESVRKGLLRTPINGARISSGFGMRNHPILGYTKMHKGVDFAAPTGTPIYASGDGVINFVGIKGGYGNYLQIKHNDQYASAYAHLSRFATGIAQGKKVKQGQIVAYVGSTGSSTGPHLHYEILVAGNQVNPANVKFKTGNVLAGKELASFKRNVESLQAQLNAMPKNGGKLALLDDKFQLFAN